MCTFRCRWRIEACDIDSESHNANPRARCPLSLFSACPLGRTFLRPNSVSVEVGPRHLLAPWQKPRGPLQAASRGTKIFS